MHIGSIGAFLEPGATVVEQIVSAQTSAVVSFDPNVRPHIIGDRWSATTRFHRLLAHADVVKLSDEDAGWLLPGYTEAEVFADVLARGPRLVAITLGPRGSVLAAAGGARTEVASAAVEIADTIGAGDTYMAAMIYDLAEEVSDDLDISHLTRIGEFATRAAGVTVQRVGADPPSLADLDL